MFLPGRVLIAGELVVVGGLLVLIVVEHLLVGVVSMFVRKSWNERRWS